MTRCRRRVAAVATACLLVFAGFVVFGPGGAALVTSVGDVVAVLSSAFAVACAAAAAARSHGKTRASWTFIAAGCAGWVVGDLIWAYTNSVRHTPLEAPSVIDACYLFLPVAACLAGLVTPLRQGSRSGLRLVLDAVIVPTSLFVVLWALVLQDLFATGAMSGVQFAVSLTYPLTDLMMLAITLLLVSRAKKGFRRATGLLSVALVVIVVSDAMNFYLATQGQSAGPFVEFGRVAGMYVVGLAGLNARADATPPEPRPPSAASLWLPYLPVPFAVALGGGELWPRAEQATPVLIASLLLIGSAMVRQVLLLGENRRLLVTVADLAMRDSLTGLANRALFTDRLAHAMNMRAVNSAPVSVLSVDLDDFKLVNDSLGHPAGDALLRCVGHRIQQNVRAYDTVARLGGDEFAILVEDTAETAGDVAQRVVRAFHWPFKVEGRDVYARPSIGLATAPSTGDDELTADELFKRADLAMYSAKRDHYSGARTFTSDMRMQATELALPSRLAIGRREGVSRIQLLGDLRRAIDERCLTLVYQPKVSLSTGGVVGVEALVRWPHPDLGTLEPADFLPLARQNGLMEAVTDLVVSRAVSDAAGWYAAGIQIPLAINLSAPSLTDETIADLLLSTLDQHGLTADALTVEITEDLLLASVIRARNVLDRLRSNGIRVAIDDFGSGYAAMTYLHELPIDELKLDRHFIAPILHDARAAAIVRSVIELANTFGLSSVAEGVENEATARRLADYGCHVAQGYFFSPPVPVQAVRSGTWGSTPTDTMITPAAAVRSLKSR